MKKIILLIILFISVNIIYSQNIPQPKNNQLYTEFTSTRTAKYLKKPLTANGFIVMDGLNNFLFKQTDPVLIEIKKIKGKITYKKGDNDPIEIDSKAQEFLIIFDNPENINKNFDIKKEIINKKDFYTVTPKNGSNENIIKILITAVEDKIEIIEIYFTNGSKHTYKFRNTVTGKKPDEKYFKK